MAEQMGDRRRALNLQNEAYRLLQDAPRPLSSESLAAISSIQMSLSLLHKSNHQYKQAELLLLSSLANSQRKVKQASLYGLLAQVEVSEE